VTVTVRYRHFFWMEDLIKLVEGSASSEVFSLLKRTDEKYVTETAYNNPRFVEDVVREVAVKLRADENFHWFSVAAENFESIHNHSAYAYLEYTREEGAEGDALASGLSGSGEPSYGASGAAAGAAGGVAADAAGSVPEKSSSAPGEGPPSGGPGA
jgi:hypothetical protein